MINKNIKKKLFVIILTFFPNIFILKEKEKINIFVIKDFNVEPIKPKDLDNLHLIKHKKYYYTDISYEYDVSASLDSGYKVPNKEKFIVHCIWFGKIIELPIISIKSFLVTQNSYSFKMWLWIGDEKFYNDIIDNPKIIFLQNKFPNFGVRLWIISKEIKGTIFEDMEWFFTPQKSRLFASDDFRILALYKYGGIYFDLDTFFLRDLGPLLKYEFIPCWGKVNNANNALMHFKKKSKNMKYIISKFKKTESSQPWILFNYGDQNLKNITLIPNYAFDPAWQCSNNPLNDTKGFFKEFNLNFPKNSKINSIKDFFPNSYAYHWHNLWSSNIYKNSYIGILQKEIDKLIEKKISKTQL